MKESIVILALVFYTAPIAGESCVGLSGQDGQCMKTLDCLRLNNQHVGQCTLETGRVGSCCLASNKKTNRAENRENSKRQMSRNLRWRVDDSCRVIRSSNRRRGRILGGSDVEDDQHPAVVKLMNNYGVFGYRLMCGGSLLKNGWVLTAAHCLDLDVNKSLVRYGVYNPSTGKREYYKPLITILHPDWDAISPAYNYDAALVKLNISSSTIRELKPVCVSPTRDLDNVTATVSGWGLEDVENRWSVSENLKELKVSVYPEGECFFEKVQDDRFKPDQMMCAGQDSSVVGQDPCKGDSGGGLIVNGEAVIGLLSWGLSCGRINRPSVFQRISVVYNWIQNIIE